MREKLLDSIFVSLLCTLLWWLYGVGIWFVAAYSHDIAGMRLAMFHVWWPVAVIWTLFFAYFVVALWR